MKITNFEKMDLGIVEHWLVPQVVSIILFAPSISSCCTTKQQMSQSKAVRDSIVIREIREIVPVTIPQSKVQIAIPAIDLRKLPPGASYAEKSGQAAVEVKYVPDNPTTGEPEYIIVTSTCDSLQVLCTNQEKELIRIRSDTQKELIETTKDIAKQRNIWLIIGLICGVCVAVAARFMINKIKGYL